jgi:hypothetical protein
VNNRGDNPNEFIAFLDDRIVFGGQKITTLEIE